jgi:signal transduction histidine kinase
MLTGLLPALLRPGRETMLAGCLAIVMASILVTPFSSDDLPGNLLEYPVIDVISTPLLVRLLNGVALGPLALHFSVFFPLRKRISSRFLGGIYLASFVMLALLLVVNTGFLRSIFLITLVIWTLGLLVVAAYLLLRAGRDTSSENMRASQQARLLFFCLVLAELPALLRPLGLLFRIEIIPYDVFLGLQIFIPLGVAYTVLRHDLFGIDSALRRALAYAVLSVLLLAVYFGLTLAMAAIFSRTWPGFRGLAALVSLFIAALAFEPTRRRIQFLIDRALYPDRISFQSQIVQAQLALEGVVSRQEVIRLLTEELPPRLGVSWASLSLTPAPDLPGSLEGEPAWNAQLMVGGKSLGRYWLGSRRAGPSFDLEEKAQLQSLAGQAALALAYADTIEELNSLNRELEARVAQRTSQMLEGQRALAAHEERQRLARDLHDSVTQSLFSINLSARALRNLVRQNPESAIAGLSELEKTAQQALQEMRTLLAQLRSTSPTADSDLSQAGDQPASTSPLALEDLVPTLVEYCRKLHRSELREREARQSGLRQPAVGYPGTSRSEFKQPEVSKEAEGEDAFPGLEVDLDLPPKILLPASVARQVMQIIREALHNVVKHSGVTQADCRAWLDGDCLALTVTDRGRGFDPENTLSSGFGLRGMQERAQSLGGRLEIQSSPSSGVVLTLTIPIINTSPSSSSNQQL